MTHSKRTGSGGNPRTYNTDPHIRVGKCSPCGKYIHLSRKTARMAAKALKQDVRPKPYRCPANDQHWHIGHVPDSLRQGRMSRGEWDQWRRGAVSP